MIRLETERIILRPFDTGDYYAVHSYASVLENVKYMDFGPNTEEETANFLRQCEENWARNPILSYDFAIVLKPVGRVIGGCGLFLDRSRVEGTLGWIIHRNYWGNGYTPEAAAEVMRFGFTRLRLHRIYATCMADNYGSWRVMEKLGMRREARHIERRLMRGAYAANWIDEFHYAILEDEWYRMRKTGAG